MVRVLIVDDDSDMQENIAEILTSEGFGVERARNGEQALDLLASNEFDLVLLDLIMPGLGGMDLLPSVKRLNPRAQVIMITAFATVENAVKAMKRGANDYIAKPFKINELLVAVKKCLEEARFQNCKALLDMDDTFGSLAHATRRQILLLLKQTGKMRFMEVTRKLEIEDHTKMNFHLKVLKEAGLIKQTPQKQYQLTRDGIRVIECLNAVVKGLSG